MSATISKEEVERRFTDLSVELKRLFNQGYEEGLTPEFMLTDVTGFIRTQTELRDCDSAVQTIWEEWKKERGI